MRRITTFCVVRINPITELPVTKNEYFRFRSWAYRRTHPGYYNKEKAELNRKYQELSQLVFTHYGLSCNRCGFDDKRALHLHHINYDGKEHRAGKGSLSFYKKVIAEGYPEGLEVLCANCHAIEHR